MLTSNISSLTLLCHCNIKIWLVESKPIRSNATIPTSLLCVLCHRKFLMIRGKEYFFAQMTSSAMCYVIYHPFPINDVGVDSPGWEYISIPANFFKAKCVLSWPVFAETPCRLSKISDDFPKTSERCQKYTQMFRRRFDRVQRKSLLQPAIRASWS